MRCHRLGRILDPADSVEPTGKFCLVANQNGGTVLVFRIDPETGKLEPTEGKAEVPAPVCVRFLAWPR